MRPITTLLSLIPSFASSFPTEAYSNTEIVTPNDGGAAHAHNWPSVHESAIAARRILKLHGYSTLSSVFPASPKTDSSTSNSSFTPSELAPYAYRPEDVAGSPIGLMDYHASCGPDSWDPLLIGVTIATTMRNAAAGSNVTLSMRYHVPSPAYPPQPPKEDPWAYLPANLPRFSVIGYLERLDKKEAEEAGLDECFFKTHPDGRLWAPGGTLEPHESWWARLRVQHIYFFGGFGDRARISWLPLADWQGVTDEEVDNYRLPGEKGWLEQQAATKPKLVVQEDDEEWEDPLFMKELK